MTLETITKEEADKRFTRETTTLTAGVLLNGIGTATFAGITAYLVANELPKEILALTSIGTIAFGVLTTNCIKMIYQDIRDYLNDTTQYVRDCYKKELID